MILKENQVFAVSDLNGDAPAGNDLGLGLYREDTRYLCASELRVNGRPPILLNNSVDRAYVATFQLVNPAVASTIAFRQPTRRLKSVDLPTLGRPTMATTGLGTAPLS